MAESAGPAFEVHVDERELAEDLGCDAEARDGTRLPGCVKLYIPQPAGQWGAVFLGGQVDGELKLFLLAVGERHPGKPWRPSVYEIAGASAGRRGGCCGDNC